MALKETNDAKRDLMAAAVTCARRRGWTTAQLAALMRVTPGTVQEWGRGRSMGTNAQRAELAELKSPTEERPRLLEVVALLRREAQMADERNAAAWAACAFEVQKMHAARAARLRERADFLESIGAPKEEDENALP